MPHETNEWAALSSNIDEFTDLETWLVFLLSSIDRLTIRGGLLVLREVRAQEVSRQFIGGDCDLQVLTEVLVSL